MSDNKPSIAELQQVDWTEAVLLCSEAVALRNATPVLLEIAAAALAYRRPIETEQDARDSFAALGALDAALSRVRP